MQAFEGLCWEVVITIIVIPPGESALQHFTLCLVLGNTENSWLSTSEMALPALNGTQCAFGGTHNSQCS